MDIRILSRDDVHSAIDMAGAIDVMREAFSALSTGLAEAPVRLSLESPQGIHLVMPAYIRPSNALGVKVVSVNPGNFQQGLPSINAAVLVMDAQTGQTRALMDGTWITALRTGAVGGLAADLLARTDATVVALFGAGTQARTQLEAVRVVREIDEVRITSRTTGSAKALADELEDIEARVVEDAAAALKGADIVITATSSPKPVFSGTLVEPGTHVTSVGSFTPEMREVDLDLLQRARIFVDQRDAALAEAGDLAGPIAEGTLDVSAILGEIGQLVGGAIQGRTGADDVTYFKSVGNAVQDVSVADRILEVAEARGLGTVFSL